MSELYGFTTVNVELADLCNKDCWMCGRRKVDRDYAHLSPDYGMIDFSLLELIAEQLPPDIIVQLHNNGEPTLYPRLGDAIKLFDKQITNFVTNGKLLLRKADQIINNLDTMAISIFENDTEADQQFEIIKKFLAIKGDRKPNTLLRINGDVKNLQRYDQFGLTYATRYIHAPEGSFNYKRDPTVPETGLCQDFLHHPAINKDGEVSICVRFDPNRLGVLGNIKEQTLEEIWNGPKRRQWFDAHVQGHREQVPLCRNCHYWGVPTGKSSHHVAHISAESVIKNVG